MAWLRSLLFVCCVLLLPSQAIANIGKVIGVKQGAELTRAGESQPLRAGMEIVSGDSISTDGSGVVQMVFVDETKIAIGPNARMMLDVSMLRGNRKAKSFAVQALGGSFRFISGKSKKRAYSIKTPTATMAVRGTTFDMWVAPGAQSAMLVLEGRVEMCGQSGNCRATGRQCSLFATTQSGNVGRPVDQEAFESALQKGFPFVQSQEQLLAPLQVQLAGCGEDTLPLPPQRAEDPVPAREQSGVKSASASAAAPARSESQPGRSTGKGNGGNVGGGTGSGSGNGGNVGGDGSSSNGTGGNVGSGSGSGNGSGGSIGGGSGSGGPGTGGTIGDGGVSGSGNGTGNGGTGGNGGNSGGG